jgi:hypothetical protein
VDVESSGNILPLKQFMLNASREESIIRNGKVTNMSSPNLSMNFNTPVLKSKKFVENSARPITV